jgi:hypothetical protein
VSRAGSGDSGRRRRGNGGRRQAAAAAAAAAAAGQRTCRLSAAAEDAPLRAVDGAAEPARIAAAGLSAIQSKVECNRQRAATGSPPM